MPCRVFVKKGRANPLWHGHPWLFSGAIERTEGKPVAGDVVEVVDIEARRIGVGFYNAASQIVVRMISTASRHGVEDINSAFLAQRIGDAKSVRTRLGLPNAETNAYRLINSEGDGLPGLTVDVFANTIVVQFTSVGMKRREGDVFAALTDLFAGATLVEVAATGVAELEGAGGQNRLVTGKAGVVDVLENGIALEVDPLGGQKTGMFLDQRDNRRRIGELARGARVLDMYTYAGGFALNALRGGATSAVCVDSSARALERVKLHATKNHLGPVETVESDAFRYLETVKPHSFDLVIVDPPKFARARKDLDAATKGYERLNLLALNACAPNALFVSASCSQLVDLELLERIVAAAARGAGRRVQLLEARFQGPDHPTLPGFAEGRYLKLLLLRVE